MREELMKSEHVLRRYNQIMSSKGTAEAEKWLGMLECSCMTCNHPVCVFRGESDHYCGNYMTAKPYTLKLVLGGTKGEQSVKDRVCACNDNHGNCNASTNNNDSATNRRH